MRLYTPEPLHIGAVLLLDARAFHHACVVMRLGIGDNLALFNEGGEYAATIVEKSKKSASVTLDSLVRPALLSPLLHLAFPILRPERIQFLIEKAAELGVTDFHPISMQHSQKTTAQAEKYKDYAQNAVQQSERFTLPTFHGLLPFKEFMKNTHDFTCVVAVEREINVPLSSTLSIFDNHLEKPSLILIGPEGGFSKEEKLMLLSNDAWHKVSLGPFILRAETAALVMLSFASTRHMTA